jgi:hypothetical protein
MKYIVTLFIFSSAILNAQEKTGNHHFNIKFGIGDGYTVWRAKTPLDNFKGEGLNLNLNLTPYYNYKNLILGITYGYEKLFIDSLISTSNSYFSGIEVIDNQVSFNKISLKIGYNFIRRSRLTFAATAHLGTYRLDKNFDNNVLKKKIAVSAGFDLDYRLSDRISLFILPNYEYKSYTFDSVGISHKLKSLNFYAGVKIKIT